MTTKHDLPINTLVPKGRLSKVATALSGCASRNVLFTNEGTYTDMQGNIHLPITLGIAMASGNKRAEALLFGKVAHEKGHDITQRVTAAAKERGDKCGVNPTILAFAREMLNKLPDVGDYGYGSSTKAKSATTVWPYQKAKTTLDLVKASSRISSACKGWFNAIEDIRMEREQELDGEQKYMKLCRDIAYDKWVEKVSTGVGIAGGTVAPMSVQVAVVAIFWAWGYDISPFTDAAPIWNLLIRGREHLLDESNLSTVYDSYNLAIGIWAFYYSGTAEDDAYDECESEKSKRDSSETEKKEDGGGEKSESDDKPALDGESEKDTDEENSEDGGSDESDAKIDMVGDDDDAEATDTEGDAAKEGGDADGEDGEVGEEKPSSGDSGEQQEHDGGESGTEPASSSKGGAESEEDHAKRVAELEKALANVDKMSYKHESKHRFSEKWTEPLEIAIDEGLNDDLAAKTGGKALPSDMEDGTFYTVNPALPPDCIRIPTAGEHHAIVYTRYQAQLIGQARTITSKMKAILQARSQSRQLRSQTRGKLDNRSLYRVNMGNTVQRNVFQRTVLGRKVDTSIMILVDQSGSMHSEGKMAIAKAAVHVVAECFKDLEACGLEWAVYGFTTGEAYRSGRYHRNDQIVHYQFKGWDESWRMPNVHNRLYTSQALMENVDHESVEWGCREVMARKAPRKIVLVISDGEPAYKHRSDVKPEKLLKATVCEWRSRGIEIAGLGIKTDAPRAYYGKESKCVSKLDQVGKALAEVVEKMFLPRR